MTPPIQALLIAHDVASPMVITVDADDLKMLQRLVGGTLEGISGGDWKAWHAYLNEEGKMLGLSPNYQATSLARKLGWLGAEDDIICGAVVFMSGNDEGEEVDVAMHVVKEASEIVRQGKG